jgi:Fic family protein
LANVIHKAAFWRNNADKILNGFDGRLTTSKWAKISKCSSDTALRDIQDLISRGIIKKDEEAGGRSTNYKLV